MNKYSFAFILILSFILASCTKETPKEPSEICITASFSESSTKTTTIEGGTSVLWEPGDEMKLFFDGSRSKLTSNITEPKSIASFTGTFNGVISFAEGFSDDTPLLGLYPYRSDATADNTSISTTLPSSQVGRAGSFGKGMNISVARSNSLKMGFYNVCGGVRFSIVKEGVKSVTFEGQNGENIAGKIKISFEGNVPVVQEITEGQSKITLTLPDGGTFEVGKWYYIMLVPGTLSKGFKMTFSTDSQSATLKTSSSVTVKRSVFGSLADADEDLIYKDKSESDPQSEFISFKDPTVKLACVQMYDTDGDGEISFSEAAAVTSIDGLFDSYRFIESFDEFQYFTSVTSIPSKCFGRMTILQTITLPESISYIRSYAFSGCTSLTSFVVPKNVRYIYERAFENCTSLKSFVFEEGTLINGLSSASSSSYDGNNESRYNGIFNGCTALESFVIPASVSSIGYRLFCNCTSLKKVVFEDGSKVTAIPGSDWNETGGPFYGCSSLEEVVLPERITSIGFGAFYGCSKLSKINLSKDIQSIGDRAFYGCAALSSINLPNCKSIGSYAFYNCSSLSKVSLSDNCTTIGSHAFRGCKSLESIVLPKAITTIGSYTFYGCSSLKDITLTQYLSTIEEYAFYGCTALEQINIPDYLRSIGSYAFAYCGLTSFVIPKGVTSISSAFSHCSSLASITIPDSVTTIGNSAFSGCSSLSSITIPESVTTISGYAFAMCSNLTSITILGGVTSIAESMFSSCSSLTSITLPETVTSIGGYAFSNCSSLDSITIPQGVTSIAERTFSGCSSLASITLPETVTSIAGYAFYSCNSLSSITIPESVTSIGKYAFEYCDTLAEVNCKPIVPPTIGSSIFYGVYTLSRINVPMNSVDAYKSVWNSYSSKIQGCTWE